jgi:hypothetical protein
MTNIESWLPLADYSIKKNISISTLRRRIKSGDIKFRFDEGKYFLLDNEAAHVPTQNHRPSLSSDAVVGQTLPTEQQKNQHQAGSDLQESVFTSANRLLTELKKAYTQSLQEKEQQILALKQENVDLKTLIKILESKHQN